MTLIILKKENSSLKYYRKEGCLYECRIKFASQMAGCIPWDYPTTMDMSNTEICLSGQWKTVFEDGALQLFEKYMQNDSALENCNCEANCEEVAYHLEVNLNNCSQHVFVCDSSADFICKS